MISLFLTFGIINGLALLVAAFAALVIAEWARKDPLLFLPLFLVMPIVIGLWVYEHRQWSALLGFAALLMQALLVGKYEGRSRVLWSDLRRYLCKTFE